MSIILFCASAHARCLLHDGFSAHAQSTQPSPLLGSHRSLSMPNPDDDDDASFSTVLHKKVLDLVGFV